VDSADAVDALPPVTEAHKEFNEDVVEVNRGLAVAYHARDRERDASIAERSSVVERRPASWELRWATDLPKERF
jgi:SulP family sulfate permease